MVSDTNPNFALNGLEAVGEAAGGYFALVEILIQQPPKLIVDVEHHSHNPAV